MPRAVFHLFLASFCSLAAVLAEDGDQAPAGPHLVLVGDSTVTDNAGWGLGFRQFLAEGVTLTNTARGGRSSRTFLEEGRWRDALALQGDYYLIQFGHNDQPGKPERSTTMPQYRKYLQQYVDDARAAGATPVLVTPLVRREFKDRENPDRIVSSLAPWAETVREVARERNVPVIELHDLSKELCEKMGREGVGAISPIKPNGNFDGTHLNSAGYIPFGRLVAMELKRVVPGLAPLIVSDPHDPNPRSSAQDFDAVVSFDGSGTHLTVQSAIDAAPTDSTRDRQFRILVLPGTYREHVVIPAAKQFIQLMGEPGEETRTVITMGTNVKSPNPAHPGQSLSTAASATALVEASDITVRSLTFANSTTREDRVQALACFITGDRVAFHHCRFLGWQDTLRPDAPKGTISRQYFRECYVEGHVDYIYAAGTAVFDRCHIHSKADGYITAPSTPASTPHGFVFLDCRLTTGPGVERGVYFSRPWRPHGHTALIRCQLEGKIRPAGWNNWGNADNEKTARYSEYKSTGPGAAPDERASWARQLGDEEARGYTVHQILGGEDRWNPAR